MGQGFDKLHPQYAIHAEYAADAFNAVDTRAGRTIQREQLWNWVKDRDSIQSDPATKSTSKAEDHDSIKSESAA